ncbi:MAG: 2Fe-2S iron-sulfur cluster binding domain-containing protein [Gammaproteobacteria bacterium]|nr:2Fe-2S iron-sulfur cluster binding domain-containing protein [Gammaproteobacteria bacterium]
MAFTITVADTGERFPCAEGQNVLAAMVRLGRRDIPVGCRGGGCGICRVQVLGAARYRTLKMSRAQVSAADEARGIALACKLLPEADLTVKALGLLECRLNPVAGGAPHRG